ncbi:hypothetical protein TNIN_24151 [Trichonephila inaurata madagascariensis]|uniref:Uncharacterized protein n=1 Tax=Trichonephila inaurata madagascariensis TaxID=2747483 RepID=A0A8X6X1J8_9ARAC|nr:hypothetical protein TNIN_24151 [Trichonephila inaurata madagascariensis]
MANDPIFKYLVEKVFLKSSVEILSLNMDKNKDCTQEVTLIKNLLEIFPKVFAVLEISIKKNWKKSFDEGSKELTLKSSSSYVGVIMTLCRKENEEAVDII